MCCTWAGITERILINMRICFGLMSESIGVFAPFESDAGMPREDQGPHVSSPGVRYGVGKQESNGGDYG